MEKFDPKSNLFMLRTVLPARFEKIKTFWEILTLNGILFGEILITTTGKTCLTNFIQKTVKNFHLPHRVHFVFVKAENTSGNIKFKLVPKVPGNLKENSIIKLEFFG